MGNNIPEVLIFIIKHPFETIKLLFINNSGNHDFDGVKFEFYYAFLLSGGIFLFLKPQFLIMFILLIAQKMLNDSYIRWE